MILVLEKYAFIQCNASIDGEQMEQVKLFIWNARFQKMDE